MPVPEDTTFVTPDKTQRGDQGDEEEEETLSSRSRVEEMMAKLTKVEDLVGMYQQDSSDTEEQENNDLPFPQRYLKTLQKLLDARRKTRMIENQLWFLEEGACAILAEDQNPPLVTEARRRLDVRMYENNLATSKERSLLMRLRDDEARIEDAAVQCEISPHDGARMAEVLALLSESLGRHYQTKSWNAIMDEDGTSAYSTSFTQELVDPSSRTKARTDDGQQRQTSQRATTEVFPFEPHSQDSSTSVTPRTMTSVGPQQSPPHTGEDATTTSYTNQAGEHNQTERNLTDEERRVVATLHSMPVHMAAPDNADDGARYDSSDFLGGSNTIYNLPPPARPEAPRWSEAARMAGDPVSSTSLPREDIVRDAAADHPFYNPYRPSPYGRSGSGLKEKQKAPSSHRVPPGPRRAYDDLEAFFGVFDHVPGRSVFDAAAGHRSVSHQPAR